jgi:hypothetical protein
MVRSFVCAWALVIGTTAGAAAYGDQSSRFALGVEYMVPGFAEVYAKTGVTWAKAMGKGFAWGDIEPEPPVDGKHNYRWEPTDQLILEYQRAGFRHFHIYVKSMNRWASSKPVKLVVGGSSLPKPEYMEDYRAYLRALVQRYDTYLELLRVAYPTVKQANPRAKVILIGFFLAGVFEGHPDPKEILANLAAMPAKRRRTCEQYLAEMRQMLAHPELFDVVEFHSLSDWSEISGMARFLRQTMSQHGYEKPIWVGDVNYTASPLMFWGIPVPPYTEQQKPAIQNTLQALARPGDPRHTEAMAWLRAEQSWGLVKKSVLAMAEGLAGINIGNLKDEGLFGILPQITGTVAFQGLIETHGVPPKPGEPRPAYHALTLLAEKLGAFSVVESLPAGRGVYAYRFTVRRRPVYVLWFDDGRRYLPGDPEPAAQVKVPLPAGQYRLTETPTARGPVTVRTVSVAQGGWNADLSCMPIFLEPIEEP